MWRELDPNNFVTQVEMKKLASYFWSYKLNNPPNSKKLYHGT